jgi:hypothetical protein
VQGYFVKKISVNLSVLLMLIKVGGIELLSRSPINLVAFQLNAF